MSACGRWLTIAAGVVTVESKPSERQLSTLTQLRGFDSAKLLIVGCQ